MMNGLTTKEWEACSAQGADEDGSRGDFGWCFSGGGYTNGNCLEIKLKEGNTS